MGTTTVTHAGNSDIVPVTVPSTRVYGAGNSNMLGHDVRRLLHVSGSRGLVRDAAGGALTNGRSSVATVLSAEGIYNAVLANEIRYVNARRVRQYVNHPENWLNASWGINVNMSVAGGAADPYGGNNAFTLTANAASAQYQSSNLGYTAGSAVASQCWVRRRTGTGIIYMQRPAGDSVIEIKIDNTWRLVKNPDATSVTNAVPGRMGFRIATSGDQIDVFFPVHTNVSGLICKQTLDYVSRGVSAKYNSGVDGCQYFTDYFPYSGLHCWGDSTIATVLMNWLEQAIGETYNGGVGGETSTQVKTRFIADTNQSTQLQLISCGTNNFTDPTTVKADIAAMVAAIPHSRYVILSPYNGNSQGVGTANYDTFKTLCSDLAALYPNNYFDVRTYIVNQYDSSQSQDVIDFANDVTPTSLRSDTIHLNDAGNKLAALAIYDFMLSKGMMDKDKLPGPFALLHEGATTNLATNPRDFTNAGWVKVNMTAAKTATGVDGVANSASTLTATAGNATVLQTIVSGSAQRISGCFIKRRTGTGDVEMTQDAGVTWTPVTVTSSWALVTIPAATLTNASFGLRIVTSGDAIDVDYFQHELGDYITSPISGSRTIDSVSIPLSVATNFKQDKGIIILKLKMKFANSAGNKALFAFNTGTTDFLYDNGLGGVALSDGTNTATAAVGGWAVDDILLIGVCYSNTDNLMSVHVSKNGGGWIDSSDATYDGAFPVGANILWASGNTDSMEIMSTIIEHTDKSHSDQKTWLKANAASEAV